MKSAFKNILLATDFSSTADNILGIALKLCKDHQAVLHLLHVVESRYIMTAPAPGISPSTLVNGIDHDARERLYNIYESVLRSYDIAVQIHMPTGIPFDEICKAADEMPIDLIIMGTHGTSGIREFFMGTTAYSVIKNSTKPVLTIPANFKATDFKNILFPVRPVNGIKRKYDLLQSFLQSSDDVSIHLAILSLVGEEEQSLWNKDELYEIIALIKNARISSTKEVYSCSNFANAVLELSCELMVDLIVINATLDYKWTHYFVGPYTQQVVNHAKMPVLSFSDGINLPAEARKEKEQFIKVNVVSS